jgi:hypothetical protein
MTDDPDLDSDALERDLRAVESALAGTCSWRQLGPRVRWAARRPACELASTLALMVASVVAAFWKPSTLLVALGLAMAVLPQRLAAVRNRRAALARLDRGEIFEMCRREYALRGAHQVMQALLEVAFVVLFGLVALFAPDPRPALVVAAIFAVAVVVRLVWALPHAARERCRLDEDTGADADGAANAGADAEAGA